MRAAAAERALAAHRRHHGLVLANLPDMGVTLYDRDLRVLVMDGRFARERGHEPSWCVGRHVSEVFPAVHGDFVPHLEAALGGEERRFDFLTPDGVPLEIAVTPQRGPSGAVEAVLQISLDVSARHAAEAARRQAEALFTSAFEGSPVGMAVTALDGTYETANDALKAMVGRDDLVGRRWQDLTHADDRGANVGGSEEVLAGGAASYHAEKRYVRPDGTEVWAKVTASLLRAPGGEPQRWFVQVVDMTERRRFEERLERMAHHDALTGLLNRRGLERALAEHLSGTDRRHGALVMLDLDGFKVVNDTLGHSSGDQLIVSAAAVLAEHLREGDVLARLGGDEFAVLLPDADRERAVRVAGRLCDAVREEAWVLADGRRRGVTVSAGVVAVGAEGARAEHLLAEADLAMYDAKGAGGDGIAVAGEALADGTPQMRERVVWLERLRGAIEDDRFVLHAQPVLDLATGRTDHFELLIRLPDGAGGLVPPGEFLPVAEQAGLIVDLDRWVVRRALDVLAAERRAGRPIRCSVNLSGRSIGDPGVLADLERGLARPGAAPGDLVIEMTETAAIGDVGRARRFADRLRDLGVALSLDDFGVGFGSFYELKHLPCEEVKIDGEFVRDCATSRTDRLVIAAVVELARGLGKRTVAEFVHDDATAQAVRTLGVDLAQGFHLGRPAPLEDVLGPA